jgi:hypothetical protein
VRSQVRLLFGAPDVCFDRSDGVDCRHENPIFPDEIFPAASLGVRGHRSAGGSLNRGYGRGTGVSGGGSIPFLSESRIRAAKPAGKAYKLYDERGLYLKAETSGSRLWRFKYRHAGKERLLALAAYPDVPLKRAREKRDQARQLLADGVDP